MGSWERHVILRGTCAHVQLSAGARPVVVLDGLDECGHGAMLARLLESVLLDTLPRNIMILVGARSEPKIRNASRDA